MGGGDGGCTSEVDEAVAAVVVVCLVVRCGLESTVVAAVGFLELVMSPSARRVVEAEVAEASLVGLMG